MSRYVKKKHGVIIGSGNVFFYRDENDQFHDFVAILSLRRYAFEQYTTANVRIRTPAEQLLWHFWTEQRDIEFEGHTLTNFVNLVRPTGIAKQWLDKHAPGWGCRPPIDHDPSPSFFFKRRKDALAMSMWIDEMLKGAPAYNAY